MWFVKYKLHESDTSRVEPEASLHVSQTRIFL